MLVWAKLYTQCFAISRSNNSNAGLTKSTLHFKAHTCFVGVAGLGKTTLHNQNVLCYNSSNDKSYVGLTKTIRYISKHYFVGMVCWFDKNYILHIKIVLAGNAGLSTITLHIQVILCYYIVVIIVMLILPKLLYISKLCWCCWFEQNHITYQNILCYNRYGLKRRCEIA